MAYRFVEFTRTYLYSPLAEPIYKFANGLAVLPRDGVTLIIGAAIRLLLLQLIIQKFYLASYYSYLYSSAPEAVGSD